MAKTATVVDEWRRELRRARDRLGMSRDEAVTRSGVSLSVWRNVETNTCWVRGQIQPYFTTANRLALMAQTVGLDPETMVRKAGLDPEDITTALDHNLPAVDISPGLTVQRITIPDPDAVTLSRDQWRKLVERVANLVWDEVARETDGHS